MTNNPYKSTLLFRIFQFFLNPLQHFASISRVPHQKPVHIILGLSIHRNYFKIFKLRQCYTKVSFGSQHLISFIIHPRFPGLGQSTYQHLLTLTLIIIDINWETLMIAHGCHHSSFGYLLNSLALNMREVEIITLSLLPNIMRSIISRPQNQIHIHLPQLFSKQHKSLKRQITITITPPIPRRFFNILLTLQILLILNSLNNFFVRQLHADIGSTTYRFRTFHLCSSSIEQVNMQI